jgi:adenosylhomocysteine nucleosidase
MTTSIIFDMDGTLFQTNKILELSLEETFRYLRTESLWNGPAPIEKYREIMGVPLPVVWETLMPSHPDDVRQKANELFLEKLIENIKQGKGALYPNVVKVLASLKESGFQLYIASNGLEKYLTAIVDQYHLNRWVTETCSIEQVASLNKSELVGMIMKKYGVNEGAVVGDRLSDIHAAKDNGLTAIGCRFDFAQEKELEHADIVINGLEELESIFMPKVEQA